jgi:3-oxoacyl-[acyl-carrier-protein] synthase I
MPDVFIASDNILSPLGLTTAENFSRLVKGDSGVAVHEDATMSEFPFYASLFKKGVDFSKNAASYTKFEQLLIASIDDALQGCEIDARDKKTVLIISTTKGNISLLETWGGGLMDNAANYPTLADRVSLYTSAKLVAAHFGFVNPPIVVSNACISGIMGILTALRLIGSGGYEHAVVVGADVISRFILSGFQAFQATSPGPCQPFDRDRCGINLGEGAGTLILSSHRQYARGIKVSGGAISNDANHLSAPSRTGEELAFAITKALREARISSTDIDFISAHGTATIYNDEMEAKAITLANLQSVPVNSLKGYYGHTLGAAGLIESIVSIHSLKQNLVLPTLGFKEPGVSKPLNICRELLAVPLRHCLKTASGFGGCNAALVLSKTEI